MLVGQAGWMVLLACSAPHCSGRGGTAFAVAESVALIGRSDVVERDAGSRPDGAWAQYSPAAQAWAGLRTLPAVLGLPLTRQIYYDLAIHWVRAQRGCDVNYQGEVRSRTGIQGDQRAVVGCRKFAAD